jgi:large subunit ribosomal protein L5
MRQMRSGDLMTGATYVPRLKERYRSELLTRLQAELGLSNVMQVPRPEKVVVNMGVGDASRDAKLLDGAVRDLRTITGQKPAIKRARKSLASFKIRQGMPIGAAVTLRGDRMWDFLDRLLSIVLPRIRDFRGLNPGSFDGTGNYSFGLTEQLVFPEIDYDDIDLPRGMDIAIVTTAEDDAGGRALLAALGFPFRQEKVEA